MVDVRRLRQTRRTLSLGCKYSDVRDRSDEAFIITFGGESGVYAEADRAQVRSKSTFEGFIITVVTLTA